MFSSRPHQGSSAPSITKSERVRQVWLGFEASLRPRRAEMEKQIQAISKLDAAPKNAPRSAIYTSNINAQVKAIKDKYTEQFRNDWDKKLKAAGLSDSDWGQMTVDEQQSVMSVLGGDDDEDRQQQHQLPRAPPLPTPPSSTLNPRPFHPTSTVSAPPTVSHPPVPVAPSFSASTRSSNLSSSSYALVNPSEFNSEPEDEGMSYFTVATSYDSQTSEDDDDAPQSSASRASTSAGFIRPSRHRSGTISQTRSKTSFPPPKTTNDGSSGLFGKGFDQEDHSFLASTSSKHQPLPPSAQVTASAISKFTSSKSELEPPTPESLPHANVNGSDGGDGAVVLSSLPPPTDSTSWSPPLDPSSSASPDSTSSSNASSLPSSSKSRSRDTYLGPILYDVNDDLDDDDLVDNDIPKDGHAESDTFEQYALRIRLQKIFDYHEAALVADCRLALQIHQARKVHKSKAKDQSQEFDVSPMIDEHQRRMKQIQMEKEEERKAVVKAERTKRKAEMQQRHQEAGGQGHTKSRTRRLSRAREPTSSGNVAQRSSNSADWLQDLESATQQQIQDTFSFERILAEDPALGRLVAEHARESGNGNDSYLRFSSTSSSPVPESPVYPSSLPLPPGVGLGKSASVNGASFHSASSSVVGGGGGATGGGFWRPPGVPNVSAGAVSASASASSASLHLQTQLPTHLRGSTSSASFHSAASMSAKRMSLFGEDGDEEGSDDDDDGDDGPEAGLRTAVPNGMYQQQPVQRGRPPIVHQPNSTEYFGQGQRAGHNQPSHQRHTPAPQAPHHGHGHGRSHSVSYSHSHPPPQSHSHPQQHPHSQPSSNLTSPTTESHFSVPFTPGLHGRPASHSGPNSASASIAGSPPKSFPAWKLKTDNLETPAPSSATQSAFPATPVSATPSWDTPLSRRGRGGPTNLNPALPPPSASAAWSSLGGGMGTGGGIGTANGGRSTPLASAWNVRNGGQVAPKAVIAQPKPTLPPKKPSNNPFTDDSDEDDEDDEEGDEDREGESMALVHVQEKNPMQGRRGSVGGAGSFVGSLGKSLFGGVLGGGNGPSGSAAKGKMINGSSPLAPSAGEARTLPSTQPATGASSSQGKLSAPPLGPAAPAKKLNKKQRAAANRKAAASDTMHGDDDMPLEADPEPTQQPQPTQSQFHHAQASSSSFDINDEEKRQRAAMENMWASMGAGRGRGAGMAPVPPVPVPAPRAAPTTYPSSISSSSSTSGSHAADDYSFNPHRHGLGPHGVAASLSTSTTSSAAGPASAQSAPSTGGIDLDDQSLFDFMASYRPSVPGGSGRGDMEEGGMLPSSLYSQRPPQTTSHQQSQPSMTIPVSQQGVPRQRMNSSDSSWGEASTPRPAHRIPGRFLSGLGGMNGSSSLDPREPGADLGMGMGSLNGPGSRGLDDFALPPNMTLRPGLFDKQETTAADLLNGLNRNGKDGNDGTIRGIPSGWGNPSGGSGSSVGQAPAPSGIRSLWGQKPSAGATGNDGGQTSTPTTWIPGSFNAEDSGSLWGTSTPASTTAPSKNGPKAGQSSLASQMLRRGNGAASDESTSNSDFGAFGSPLSTFSSSPVSSSTPSSSIATNKVGKGKKGALKARRVEVEDVANDDESQLTDSMLPVDSRFLLEPNQPIQHPRPSVPPNMYSSIIDYGDGHDHGHDDDDGNLTSTASTKSTNTTNNSLVSSAASSPPDLTLDLNDPKILKGIQELQQGTQKLSHAYGGNGNGSDWRASVKKGTPAWGPTANGASANRPGAASGSGIGSTNAAESKSTTPPSTTASTPSSSQPSTSELKPTLANGRNASSAATPAWGKGNDDKTNDNKAKGASEPKTNPSPTTPAARAPAPNTNGKGKKGKKGR